MQLRGPLEIPYETTLRINVIRHNMPSRCRLSSKQSCLKPLVTKADLQLKPRTFYTFENKPIWKKFILLHVISE